MSEYNMHVGNFAYGSLGHAINMDMSWAVTWHSMFNIKLIREGLVVCQSIIGICSD